MIKVGMHAGAISFKPVSPVPQPSPWRNFKDPRMDLVYFLFLNAKATTEYKNLAWVWGLDRKIRPEDRRSASRGLPSDDKRWARETDFSILPSHSW